MLDSSLVLHQPLPLIEESVVKSTRTLTIPMAANTLLFVVEKTSFRQYDYQKEGLHIYYASIEEASLLLDPLSKSTIVPEVILVSAELENYTDRYLIQLKEFAAFRCIPFILHSNHFDEISRNIAVEFGFDDYYAGNISEAFMKKVEFVRKMKAYKHDKGSRPYAVYTRSEMPQVRMWTLKRTFDILVSGTLLLLLMPLLVLIALIIKIESRGPIFYISKRAGNGYKIFNFYKFRSMRVNADKELTKLASQNQYGDSVFFKIQNDPRVTRFGSLLRNTSLDEIPQLFNVLIGDMSLVGNRPLPLYEAEKLTKDNIAWRFLAPAGITGLWQVTKRGKDNMSEEERIQLDVEYAMRNSFFYDIKILFSTIPALLQKEKV
jgi:lipopolysaccharide/colanic/teichoic acid biosynthesis glycosyltransferase